MNTPDHPDFTALALGEHIHGTPARAVLDALRTSVAARQEAEQIRETAARVSFVLGGLPPQRLDNKRRNEIFHADVAAVRARFAAEERAEDAEIEFAPPVVRRQRSWVHPAIAAAAVVTAAVMVLNMLPGGESAVAPSAPVVVQEKDPSGRIMVTPVPADTERPRAPGVRALPEVAAQNTTAPPPQEAPAAPPAESTAEVPRQPAPEEQLPVIEPVPTRPPWRHDPRDYTAPPRIENK